MAVERQALSADFQGRKNRDPAHQTGPVSRTLGAKALKAAGHRPCVCSNQVLRKPAGTQKQRRTMSRKQPAAQTTRKPIRVGDP